MSWQPIKTAPKDGTDVLVFCQSGKYQAVAWFGTLDRMWWIYGSPDPIKPTHWQPCPPDPEVAS